MNNELPLDLLDEEAPRRSTKSVKTSRSIIFPLACALIIGAVIYKFSPDLKHFIPQAKPNADKIANALASSNGSELTLPKPAPSAIEVLTDHVSAIESDLKNLRAKQEQQFLQLENLQGESKSLKAQVNSYDSSMTSVSSRLDKMVRRQQWAASIAKPKAESVPVSNPVALVSVKNYNGKIGITLRQYDEFSPMVLVGQSWRGYTLVTADPGSRQAVISAAGKTQNLSL